MIEFWIAQGIGFIVCLLALYCYFRKTKERFLYIQVIINVLYSVMYALLGVWSGVVANLITTVRFISFRSDVKAGRTTALKKSVFFCILSAAFGIAVYDGIISLIPVVVAVLITFATAQDDPVVIRVAFAISNVMWVLFNFVGRAYVSAVYSAVELVVSLISIVLILKIKGKNKEEKSKEASEPYAEK